MKTIVAVFISLLFLVSSSAYSADCSSSDFVSGAGYVVADRCAIGHSSNPDLYTDLIPWAGSGWSEVSRYEADEGAAEFGPLAVSSTTGAYDFAWNVGASSIDGSAMFVVKQGNNNPNWAAYIFDNLGSAFGFFNIDEELQGNNDYSHLRLYTQTPVESVPEIDVSAAALALILLAGLVALGRERPQV